MKAEQQGAVVQQGDVVISDGSPATRFNLVTDTRTADGHRTSADSSSSSSSRFMETASIGNGARPEPVRDEATPSLLGTLRSLERQVEELIVALLDSNEELEEVKSSSRRSFSICRLPKNRP